MQPLAAPFGLFDFRRLCRHSVYWLQTSGAMQAFLILSLLPSTNRLSPMKYRQDFRQKQALFTLEGVNTIWGTIVDDAALMTLPKHYEVSAMDSDAFFLLVRGSLRLSCLAEDGQERTVMRLGSGTLFNEVAQLHLSPMHAYSMHTLEECEVAKFPKSLLDDEEFYRTHPALIRNLVQSIGIKAGAFFSQLFDSNLLEVHGRVCRSLYQLWKESGESPAFRPNISQGELATMLGVHRSSLCRVVHSLREKGIVGKFSKTRLEIFNPDLLRTAAGEVFPHKF